MNDSKPQGTPEGPPEADPSETSLFEAVGTGTVLLLVLSCLLLYFFFQGTLWSGEPGSGLWGLSLAPVLGILLPVALFVRQTRRSFREELWLYAPTPRQILGVTLAMAGTIPLAYAAAVLNEMIVPADPAYQEGLQSLVPHDTASLVAGFLGIVIMAPLGEEVLFRGLLLGTLGRSMRALSAIAVTGILFALTHLAPWLMLPISILGIVLGILVWLTRTLTAAWIAHALFNLAGYLEMASTGNVETPRLVQISLHPVMIVLVPLFFGAAMALLKPVDPDGPTEPPDDGGKVRERTE